jgi:hypothetical protein
MKLPRGIEAVVLLIAARPSFREAFARNREAALAEVGIRLTGPERNLLHAITDERLHAMAEKMRKGTRTGRLVRFAATASIAALAGLLAVLPAGCKDERPSTRGIEPDEVAPRSELRLPADGSESSN